MSMAVSGGAHKTADFFAKVEAKSNSSYNLAARLKDPIVFMPKVGGSGVDATHNM